MFKDKITVISFISALFFILLSVAYVLKGNDDVDLDMNMDLKVKDLFNECVEDNSKGEPDNFCKGDNVRFQFDLDSEAEAEALDSQEKR